MGKKSQLSVAEQRDVVLMLLRKEESAAVLARRSFERPSLLTSTRTKHRCFGRQSIYTMRRSDAHRASSWRLESWSLRRTADTWVSTVLVDMSRRLATCLYW